MAKVTEKKCSKCGEVKKAEEFNKRSNVKDGLKSWCKKCCNKRAADYRKEVGKEILKERRDKWRAANPERVKELDRQSKERNKEKIIADRKKYYWDNKEELNKKKAEAHKERVKNDELYALKETIRQCIKNSFRSKKLQKNGRSAKMLGCGIDFFKSYIESKFTEGMSWENYGEWVYDHIAPVASATNSEELFKLNHYTNFQPLWRADNIRKSNKIEGDVQFKIL